jgi:hypothetical protein
MSETPKPRRKDTRRKRRRLYRRRGYRSLATLGNLEALRRVWSEYRMYKAGDPDELLLMTQTARREAEGLASELTKDAEARPVAAHKLQYLDAIEKARLPAPPKPRRLPRVHTYSELRMAAARFPVWRGRNDDQPERRILGVVWWERKHIVNGLAAGGWAFRLSTRTGDYLNTQVPDDITMKELAELSDLFRWHLIAGGYMGSRKAHRKNDADFRPGRARFNDAAVMKAMADASCVQELNPDDPLHAHLLRWMRITDEIEIERVECERTGRVPEGRKAHRVDLDERWRKMTTLDS